MKAPSSASGAGDTNTEPPWAELSVIARRLLRTLYTPAPQRRNTRSRLRPSLFKKGKELALNVGMSTVDGEPVLLHKLRLIARGLVSKDFGGPYVETRTSDTQKPPARQSRGSPRWSRLIVLTLAVSVIHTSLAENYKTSEASDLTCASREPRFIVKVAIVVLMLGLFYWANRIFDKLDEASYARLSRALSRRAHARQRAGWARRR